MCLRHYLRRDTRMLRQHRVVLMARLIGRTLDRMGDDSPAPLVMAVNAADGDNDRANQRRLSNVGARS